MRALPPGFSLLAPMVIGAAMTGCVALAPVNPDSHAAFPVVDDGTELRSAPDLERAIDAASISGAGGAFAGVASAPEAIRIDTEQLVLAALVGGGFGHVLRNARRDTDKRFSAGGAFSYSASDIPIPSAYAITGFAVGSLVGSDYRDTLVIPATTYGVAAFARPDGFDDAKHWVSDVLVGSAVGYVAGKLALRHNPFTKGQRIRLRLRLKRHRALLRVSYKF